MDSSLFPFCVCYQQCVIFILRLCPPMMNLGRTSNYLRIFFYCKCWEDTFLLYVPFHYSIILLFCYYIILLLFYYYSTILFWSFLLFYYSVILLFCYSIILLLLFSYYSTNLMSLSIILLFYYSYILLFYYYSIIVLLFYYAPFYYNVYWIHLNLVKWNHFEIYSSIDS